MHEQKEEVKDNGFSHRVMRRLPRSYRWTDRLFNILCAAVCLYLFYRLDGAEILLRTAEELFRSLSLQEAFGHISPSAWGIALGVLAVMGIGKACTLDD